MRTEFKKTEDGKVEVHIHHPNIKRVDGKIQYIGSCWVKGDSLDCYGWEDEDQLLIIDKIPAEPEDIPVDQYYVLNTCKQETGWVLKDQVTFELKSLIGAAPFRVREV